MLNDTEVKSAIKYELVKDPIYGYVRLYDHELEIVDTPTFQRLRRIKQLSSAHFVYPGATHTRFSHSLGVMHLCGLFVKCLLESLKNARNISDDTFLHFFFLMRLWGLTHDLGHGPFCHTFDKVILQENGLNHEYMSSKLVQEDEDIVGIIEKKLKDFEIKPKTLADYLGKSREEWSEAKTLGKTENSEAAFYYVMKGFYSADIIDYLLRDNLYTGAGYGNFDWQRLVLSSHLHKNEVALEIKSRDTLDAFLLSRLFSFNTIYYHRLTRAVDHIIKSFLTKAKERIDFKRYADDVDEYKELDEQSIFHMRELSEIPERTMLINRIIPFRQVDQVVLSTSEFAFLSEDILGRDLSSLLSEKLGNKIPNDAYFIDTPDLDLNPMRGEDEVCMIDISTSPPTPSWESIRKTSWGEVPNSVRTIRIYLDKDHEKFKAKVKNAFRTVIKGEKKLRTHF